MIQNMAPNKILQSSEYAPCKIIASMKYEATDNFVRENSLCRDAGEPVYDPKFILDIVPRALESCNNDVDRMYIHEQEFLAALNLGNSLLAEKIFEKISNFFPPSKYRRARAYKGFLLESKKNYDEAGELYSSSNSDAGFYPLFWRRLVALSLAKGDRKKSISTLVDYLDVMAQDTEGWSQLAKLYLYESMYSRAAFCYEELMVIIPQNHVLFSRYADVVYTLGRPDLAIRYYCKSLSLYPDYLRALYGIHCCAKLLLGCGGNGNAKSVTETPKVFSKDPFTYDKDKVKKCFYIACDRIKKMYNTINGPRPTTETSKVVNLWLESN